MNKKIFIAACLLMAVAVILGAIGAHSLKERLSTDMLQSFESGVRYQIYHSLALLLLTFHTKHFSKKLFRSATTFFFGGVLFFSGSIYALAIASLADVELAPHIWWVTPLGGMYLIAAWLFLALSAIRNGATSASEEA